jgi:threonyl-tRNA synthetase
LRVDLDEGNERMQAKIRNGQLQKIPYLLIVGDQEIEADAVAVRKRGGEDLGVQSIDAFLTGLREEVQERRRE